MQKTNQIATVTTEPVRVDVRAAEKELANLWRAAIGGAAPGTAAQPIRAILSNILIFAASDQEAEDAMQTVAQLIADHPARVVVADAEPGDPETEADVSMLCSITERGRRLCGEEIRIRAHSLTAASLGDIMPVLVPDLPIYLWTPGDLSWDEKISRYLTRISDYWIIDSRRLTSHAERLALVSELGPGHRPPVRVYDLAWASLNEWREAVAQHFDPVPAREYLRGVQSIEITYRPLDGGLPTIQPLLMASWLIGRLRLEDPQAGRHENGAWIIAAESGGSPIQIRLIPSSSALMPIDEITIRSELNGRTGVFRNRRGRYPDELSIEADAPDVPNVRRTIRLTTTSPRDEVLQVLNQAGRDRLFERALPVLRRLIEELGKA